MFASEGKARSFSENAKLAITLSGVAGAVNATGFFVVGTWTSHVTGHVARVGDELAQGRVGTALAFLSFVFAFFIGAVVATLLVEGSRRLGGRAHYKSALLVELAALGAYAFLAATPVPAQTLIALLCFAMGLQNALVTKVSGAVVRTTHLTGVTTDLGIEFVHLVFYFRERAASVSLRRKLHVLWQSLREPVMEPILLHLSIFISFLVGATAGPLLYLRIGNLALLLPSAFLLVLVVREALMRRRRMVEPASASASAPSGQPS